jgi:hypothetical protein
MTAIMAMIATGSAQSREFGRYECTDDCSGHKAGYEWAERRHVTDSETCDEIVVPYPNRTSFAEGCMVYVDDPSRGAERDDDGEDVD